MIGAVLAAPIEWPPFGRRALGITLAAVFAAWVLLLQPERSTLTPSDRLLLGAPGWRIPPMELEAVRALVDHSPPGSQVLAPYLVSRWIPAFHHHPFPLVVFIVGCEAVRRCVNDSLYVRSF